MSLKLVFLFHLINLLLRKFAFLITAFEGFFNQHKLYYMFRFIVTYESHYDIQILIRV